MSKKSFFVGLAFLLLVGTFMFLSTSQTAHAANHIQLAACHGSSCNGLDPASEGCVANSTVEGQQLVHDNNNKTIGTVTLEYSHTCDTWWGFLSSVPTTKIQTTIWNAVYSFYRVYGSANNMYSFMVYDGVARSTKCIEGDIFSDSIHFNDAIVCHGP